MAVRVRFFGATAELVGKYEIDIRTDDTTVAEVLDRLILEYPALAKLDLKFAVNQEYASSETAIECAGDELAVFTAVSGG
jgi:molybdopterin converting factor small subunit